MIDFALLSRATTESKAYKAGETIFKVGDVGTQFFVISEGKVAIHLGNRTLGVLDKGDIFGEMALVDAAPRSADAVAETDCVVVPVGEKQFLFMVDEAPYFALSIMKVLAARLRSSNAALPSN